MDPMMMAIMNRRKQMPIEMPVDSLEIPGTPTNVAPVAEQAMEQPIDMSMLPAGRLSDRIRKKEQPLMNS